MDIPRSEARSISSPHDLSALVSRSDVKFLCYQDLIQKPRIDVSFMGSDNIASALENVTSTNERIALIEGKLSAIGFNSISYSCSPLISRVTYFLPTFWPRGLAKRYFLRGDDIRDARTQAAAVAGGPIVWDIDSLVDENASADQRGAFIEDFLRNEMRSGLAFSFVSRQICARITVMFSADAEISDWISDATVGRAYVLGMGLHAFIISRLNFPGYHSSFAGGTTIRQRILGMVAAGLPDREIGQCLRMTPYNIDYHLRELRKALGARNRAQLAYLAGSLHIY